MVSRINKINNIQTNLQNSQIKTKSQKQELLFSTGNNPDGNVYTKESANRFFEKLLKTKGKSSLLDKAVAMTEDGEVSALTAEGLKLFELPQADKNVQEAIVLNSSNGEKFYLIKYKDNSTQIFYPDNTSVYKNVTYDDEYYNSYDKYLYDNGNLVEIQRFDIDKYKQETSVEKFTPDENGYYTGYAVINENLKDVLKNLGIEENSAEAEEFIALNSQNIKEYGPNKVKAFVVGSEMHIPVKNALNCKYIRSAESGRWDIKQYNSEERARQDKYDNNMLEKANADFIYTKEITLKKDSDWYLISKENLQREQGIQNPTKQQIENNMYVLMKLNRDYKSKTPVLKDRTITIINKTPENRPEKLLLQTYRPENLKNLYPEDKYTLEADKYDDKYTIRDKNNNAFLGEVRYSTESYWGKTFTGVHISTFIDKHHYALDIDNKGNVTEEKYPEQNGNEYRQVTSYDSMGNKTVSVPINPKYKGLGTKTITYDKSGAIAEQSISVTDMNKYLKDLVNIVKNNDLSAVDSIPTKFGIYSYKLEDLSKVYEEIKDLDASYILKSKVFEKINHLAQKKLKIVKPKDTPELKFELQGEKLIIKNTVKNTTHTIDFGVLLEEFTPIERMYLKEQILKMNPQAIEDLSIEIKKFKKRDNMYGYFNYSPFDNTINIPPQRIFDAGMDTITHELGHAVDFNGILNIDRYFRIKYITLFVENLKKFLADGNVKSSYINKYAKEWFPKTFGYLKSGQNVYATENEAEMFAECYTYIMNGQTNATKKELFEKYFSENVEMTRQILDEIREMPDAMRCRSITNGAIDVLAGYGLAKLLLGIPPGTPGFP